MCPCTSPTTSPSQRLCRKPKPRRPVVGCPLQPRLSPQQPLRLDVQHSSWHRLEPAPPPPLARSVRPLGGPSSPSAITWAQSMYFGRPHSPAVADHYQQVGVLTVQAALGPALRLSFMPSTKHLRSSPNTASACAPDPEPAVPLTTAAAPPALLAPDFLQYWANGFHSSAIILLLVGAAGVRFWWRRSSSSVPSRRRTP